MKKTFILVALGLLFYTSYAQKKSEYKIANTFHLEGDGGWDYLISDDETNRLFISHSTVVQVIDEQTGKLLGTIFDTKGVHGIALAHDLNKGFISNGKDSSVTIFDLKTLETITKINVSGKNPDAILYDEFSHRVFTFNGKTANATVIDAKENKVIATIPLDGKPEFSVTNDKGKIYVNIEDKSELSVIDATTLNVLNTWSIAPGQEPSGLAFDKETNRLFCVCDNKLMVIIDAENGKIMSTIPIGERTDGAAFDPKAKRIFSSNGDGTLTAVNAISSNKYKVIENLPTQKGARTIALNYKTHHLFLPTAEYGEVPAATTVNPKPRATIKPNSFVILDVIPITN